MLEANNLENKILSTIRQIRELFGSDANLVDYPIICSFEDNFSSLRVDKDHISTSEKDTFYLKNGDLLRTHTSCFQSKVFKEKQKEIGESEDIGYICIGPVFRRDTSTRSHNYFFNQIDGVYFVHRYKIEDYIFSLCSKIKKIIGRDVKFRVRTSFFPFTHPSYEIDIEHNGNFIEILGCGMIHEEIRKKFCIKPGFAFGMGIERITMIKYNMSNIREARMS